MPITSIRIHNFRNLAEAELAPCKSGLNIICGANGSGKTSLLESIYYLGLGRSFRTSSPLRLIRQTTEQFSIFSQLVSDSRDIPVGVERDVGGNTRLRVAETDVASIAELAACLPVQLINSQSHHLFESGPVYRRKFIDWGLFYHIPGFFTCWRQYERVLKQRNSVLRERRPKNELQPWTDELVHYGLMLDAYRLQYVLDLVPLVAEIAQELLEDQNVEDNLPIGGQLEFEYHSGWEKGADFAAILADAFAEEMQNKHTLYGPHRADLSITIKGVPVKHFLSRGQQKLLICAMMIAQGKLLQQHANKGLIYLVDDLPAELDLPSRQKLVSLLCRQQTQVFITTIEYESIYELVNHHPDVSMKVFHVEHGNVCSRNSML